MLESEDEKQSLSFVSFSRDSTREKVGLLLCRGVLVFLITDPLEASPFVGSGP